VAGTFLISFAAVGGVVFFGAPALFFLAFFGLAGFGF
jgi:hypothetical protein